MFEDFWKILAAIIFGIGAYHCGKKTGVQQTVTHYNTQDLIKSQQLQIDDLNAKLNALTVRNP